MKTLIVYVFYRYTRNVEFFFKYGVQPGPEYHYCIVENLSELTYPEHKVIQLSPYIRWIKRANHNQDWGGYAHAIKQYDLSKYTHFVFLNSSVCGPFFPKYYHKIQHWTTCFTEMLRNDVGLAGISINFWDNNIHVQSMLFTLRYQVLQYLLGEGVFTQDDRKLWSHHDLVINAEIHMSQVLLKANYNLDCLLSVYRNVDWRKPLPPNLKPVYAANDLWWSQRYHGIDIHPFETIFVKANRSFLDPAIETFKLNYDAPNSWFSNFLPEDVFDLHAIPISDNHSLDDHSTSLTDDSKVAPMYILSGIDSTRATNTYYLSLVVSGLFILLLMVPLLLMLFKRK